MKKGDWIEGYKGIGIIDKICPIYFEEWDKSKGNIPENKKIGDKSRTIIIMKQLCNYDYKKSFRRHSFNKILSNPITKESEPHVKRLLSDIKIEENFRKYKGNEIIDSVSFNLNITNKQIENIELSFKSLSELKSGMKFNEINNWFIDQHRINLLNEYKGKSVCNVWVSLYNKDFKNKNKNKVFTDIKIVKS